MLKSMLEKMLDERRSKGGVTIDDLIAVAEEALEESENLCTQLAAKDTEIAGLRKDKARLDWIDEVLDPGDIDYGDTDGKWKIEGADGVGYESDCLRDAIDAAMKPEPDARGEG